MCKRFGSRTMRTEFCKFSQMRRYVVDYYDNYIAVIVQFIKYNDLTKFTCINYKTTHYFIPTGASGKGEKFTKLYL